MKTFGMLFVSLFFLFLFQGTASAVLGVDDNVPGQDVLFPVICGVTAPLNTSWAISDVMGGATDLMGNAARAEVMLYNTRGNAIFDYIAAWTPYDVVTGNCKSLIQQLSSSSKAAVKKTIDGADYYVGFLAFFQEQNFSEDPSVRDRFTGWITLRKNETDAGLKPFQAEQGLAMSDYNPPYDRHPFAENGSGEVPVPVTAKSLILRFSIDNAASKNWWIVLTGVQSSTSPGLTRMVRLNGLVCDENENCLSVALPVADLLNFYNVSDYVPAGLFPGGFPKRGFAKFDLVVSETDALGHNTIYTPSDISTFAWSYVDSCILPLPVPFKVQPKVCLRESLSIFPADRIYVPLLY